MYVSCLEIQNKVSDKLKNDPALAGYVKEFSVGRENVMRMIYPYVTVAGIDFQVEAGTLGRKCKGRYIYDIIIQTGTQHILPDVARLGNGSDKKGIVQLNDDVVAAVFPDNLDGLFNPSLTLSLVTAAAEDDSGGRIWRGTIVLSGQRRQYGKPVP